MGTFTRSHFVLVAHILGDPFHPLFYSSDL